MMARSRGDSRLAGRPRRTRLTSRRCGHGRRCVCPNLVATGAGARGGDRGPARPSSRNGKGSRRSKLREIEAVLLVGPCLPEEHPLRLRPAGASGPSRTRALLALHQP